jgi:hypothetical protein
MSGLTRMGEGKPSVSSDLVFEELSRYPWSDWEEADLKPTIHYLYGNRNLQLPLEWRLCFPTKI